MTRLVTVLFAFAFLRAQEVPQVDATRGLLAAWDQHLLVAVSEGHRVVQDKEFLLTLIASQEFPAKVNDIVIEFGNARLQPVLDRYMAGEGVSRAELSSVWTDTTVVNGLWDAPIYERFLAAVRERNQGLAKHQRLRVLACDPPIDWANVKTISDAAPYLARDAFCASLIEREVIVPRRRALVIMGDAHVGRRDVSGQAVENVTTLVERKHPGTVFVALTYLGQYKDSASIEERLGDHIPSLTLLESSRVGELPAVPPKAPIRTRVGGGQSISETVAITDPPHLKDVGDALLYLGPKSSLTRSTPAPEQLSPEHLRELDRRHRVLFGLPLDRKALLE